MSTLPRMPSEVINPWILNVDESFEAMEAPPKRENEESNRIFTEVAYKISITKDEEQLKQLEEQVKKILERKEQEQDLLWKIYSPFSPKN